jgi:hypothetical protein
MRESSRSPIRTRVRPAKPGSQHADKVRNASVINSPRPGRLNGE